MIQWFHSLFSVSRIHDIWRLINALTATLMSVNKAVSADVLLIVIAEVLKSLGGPVKRDSLLGPTPPHFSLTASSDII